MFKIKIVAIGKIKEQSVKDLILEYEKRLKRFCDFEIIEIEDIKEISDNEKDIQKVVDEESNKILKYIEKKDDFKILFDIKGKEFDSLGFSQIINRIKNEINKNIIFIIGGSNGVNEEIKDTVDMKISFSKLTFPHQLFRVIVLEQIYRSFKIINNEKYHK